MTYRQLQIALKQLRQEGKTSIKLNQKKVILQAEYNRLTKTNVVESEFEAWLTNHVEREENGVCWIIPQSIFLRNVTARTAMKYQGKVKSEVVNGGVAYYLNNHTYIIAA
ncbi:hypothetical protein G7B40_001655 [Aetokthonos hydrillicola Thurmond2011]|jgi:hypothetical protein|uniref:Uncharacterized protein n=1 Tax=Aetokthonos hydrillicola Thurmond2011 TaxID=2712845 RepID=A0AAP5I3X4_9CYAN|nr:hypothetical protein [Aetokthonos hydrillicola]MBO3462972.1 hypothetical protein [Aetokthonos hydrillicola CCALA 1050]MBW4591268.1 hypothetical protein [Aetokthonos hydrillicola CCALA 1050]MDR9893292.1 hypothetical protein [Aetokthonos hydrillicola Thurmond2011]